MSKTGIIGYALIVFLLLPSITFSETQEMKEHKVVKGDTLWDISKQELNNPFLWPKIWKENRWIANPHWIYPDQLIKIPLYLIQKEKREDEAAQKPEATSQEPAATFQESAKKEEAKTAAVQIIKHPLVSRSTLVGSGYIADTIPGVGQVGNSPSEQTIYGNDDLAFVAVNAPAQAGDKFYVMKVSGPVKHPITGKEIGYVITIGGIAEIVNIKDSETLARMTNCFGIMNKGDRLVSYYDIELPMATGHFRSPDINGMIVATANGTALQSMLDIIYIDKGCKDGIEVGDMFKTLAVETPAVPNGTIQVISCRDHTATAVIKSSSAPVSPGNIFAALDKK